MALKTIEYNNFSFDIAYEILNPNASTDIVILHGWGANKEIMKQAFGKTMPNFRHIYVDLAGFGKSTSQMIGTSFDYAKITDIFLREIGASKSIIVGHSFGGKVATLLEPQMLVLLSSAGILEPKPLKVKLKIALVKFLKPFKITPKIFIARDGKNLSPNMYETFKNVIAEDFRSIFAKTTAKTFIFWGKSDTATALASGELIDSLIPNSFFRAFEGDHYFFLHHAKTIANEIEDGAKSL